MSARLTFIAATLAWMSERFPTEQQLETDTRLFEGGLINSLRILELIAWVEVQTGRKIPDRAIRMDNFATVGRIAEVFIEEPRTEALHVDG
jgi:acyl carrier protein